MSCVRRNEARISALKANLTVLGAEPSETDAPEIVTQRGEMRTEISLLEARTNACRLIILRSDKVANQAAELQRQLSAQRLTSQGPAFISIIKSAPTELRQWLANIGSEMFNRPSAAGLDALRLLLVIFVGEHRLGARLHAQAGRQSVVRSATR